MRVASAVGGGGVVSHTSAAGLIGIPQVAAPDDVHQGVTTPLRTVLDCAGTLPFHEALAIADGALAYSFVRESELMTRPLTVKVLDRRARVKVAAAADRRADNPFESVLRAIAIESRVGGFVPQVEIRLPRRLLYADLADVDRRIVLEADSFAHHDTRGAFARDCDRYNDLVAARVGSC